MRRLPLLCAFLLLTGCYDSRFGERSGGEEPEPATATIAQLRQLYAGTTFVIATDVVVSGRVNTSDAEENFYRTFCVEEDGAGLEVMAGIDQLHNDFPPGSRVTLRLKGLALGESRGILQVGRKPNCCVNISTLDCKCRKNVGYTCKSPRLFVPLLYIYKTE